MDLYPDITVGEVVAQHYRTAEVFDRYGIDFCCGGKKTLGKVCADKGLDWDFLATELGKAFLLPDRPAGHAENWAPDFLAEYIIQVHHRFLRENLPVIERYIDRMVEIHGTSHPELLTVQKQLRLLSEDLLEHIEKEERILFPYIKAIGLAALHGTPMVRMPFGSIKNPIGLMEHEHDYAGSLLDSIREITGGFTCPEDACPTYRTAFAKLKELDDDLRWHVHLENNILFPKILVTEQLYQHQN